VTNEKVAGSTPNVVIELSNQYNSSRLVTETNKIFLGGRAKLARKADNLTPL
jgi:hypothetical protein